MRVALITEQLLAPVPGGIGRYTRELGAALVRTAAPGDSVSGWTARHGDLGRARIDGVDGPHRLGLPPRVLARAWARGRGPTASDAEVVHAPSLLVPPRRAGSSLVVSIHDTVPWTHPETMTRHGVAWHRAMAKRAVREAAVIGVLTAVMRDELCAVLPGLSPERVRVLGAGVSASLLIPPDYSGPDAATEVRQRLALPQRYLLSLATLEPRKGLDIAIKALARLGAGAPPLLVAGQPGWGGLDLGAAARAAGLADGAVRALGRLDDADLAVVLRDAVALVAPSRAEGFGLPVVEAMAVGTPVICSDAPALVEVAGDAALLVPVGDDERLAEAIEAVLGDDALAARLRSAGLARAGHFDWDEVARRAWQAYRVATLQ